MRLALRLSATNSRHQEAKPQSVSYRANVSVRKQRNDVAALGIMSDVGVEHRSARRRCAVLVAPAGRGPRRCRVWQEGCRIEASVSDVSS
jgi:hypothetical protein